MLGTLRFAQPTALGISAAVMLSVLNAMWYEAQECATRTDSA